MNNATLHQNRNTQNEHSVGPIVGTLIIVTLLIAAAIYLWSEHLNTLSEIQKENRNSTSTSTTLIMYNTSTEPSDIQADLKAATPVQNPGF